MGYFCVLHYAKFYCVCGCVCGDITVFGRPFVKRFALCYRSVVLSVCNVRALWRSSWMDQDETWHARRTRPWPLCVRWGPSSPPQRGTAPNFWPISVAAKWLHGSRCHLIGMEEGLGPGDSVLDGANAVSKLTKKRNLQLL